MIRVNIHGSSYGHVAPSPECGFLVAEPSDVRVERGIAETVQRHELSAGVYVAKWQTYDGHHTWEYVFTVATETNTERRVEVAD